MSKLKKEKKQLNKKNVNDKIKSIVKVTIL